MLLKSMREESVAKVASSSTRGSTTSLRVAHAAGGDPGGEGREAPRVKHCEEVQGVVQHPEQHHMLQLPPCCRGHQGGWAQARAIA